MACSCNAPATALQGLAPDATQHVNFTRGMVLGVDDFQQEFAWLSGRDQWLARDALGYGTLSGLQVQVDDDGSEGPRVRVSAGSALVPSGKLACVAADQCAVLNRWLAKPANAALVNQLLDVGSPPIPPTGGGLLTLDLVLCWADCLTRPVPIPGEPCRSDDDLMQPSRVADDYRLELRTTAPAQAEETALRDLGRWLRDNVHLVDGSTSPPPSDEAGWLAALRSAAAGGGSPPLSPPVDGFVDLPPPGLPVATTQAGDFLRTLWRLWVTELRPRWAAMHCSQGAGGDADCLLLAQISLPVTWVGGVPAGSWQASGNASTVQVDESARPLLASLRLLQAVAASGFASMGLAMGSGALAMPFQAGFGAADAAAGAFTVQPPSLPALAPTPLLLPLAPPAPAPFAATGLQLPLVSISADLLLDDSHHIVVCSGGQTVRLPKSSQATLGRVYVVKNRGADITLQAEAGDGIDGLAATLAVKKNRARTLVSDGASQWLLIGAA